MVERLVRNEEASGSNPLISTKTKTRLVGVFFVLLIGNTRTLNYQRCAQGARNISLYLSSRLASDDTLALAKIRYLRFYKKHAESACFLVSFFDP